MTLTKAQAEFLQSIDTPTVCNLLEIVAPERRGFGYTVRHLHCPFPDLPPMVGFAKTVTMRAQDRVPLGEAGYMNKRLDIPIILPRARSPASRDQISTISQALARLKSKQMCTRRWAASAPSPTVRSATFRKSRRASRCSPARSRPRTPSCMWWISAST
jgi:hypothetical protein